MLLSLSSTYRIYKVLKTMENRALSRIISVSETKWLQLDLETPVLAISRRTSVIQRTSTFEVFSLQDPSHTAAGQPFWPSTFFSPCKVETRRLSNHIAARSIHNSSDQLPHQNILPKCHFWVKLRIKMSGSRKGTKVGNGYQFGKYCDVEFWWGELRDFRQRKWWQNIGQ